MKSTAGLTRQHRRFKSKLATSTRKKKKKKTEELASVRKRYSGMVNEARGGRARTIQGTMPVEQHHGKECDTFYRWWMQTWGDQISSMEQRNMHPMNDRHIDAKIVSIKGILSLAKNKLLQTESHKLLPLTVPTSPSLGG